MAKSLNEMSEMVRNFVNNNHTEEQKNRLMTKTVGNNGYTIGQSFEADHVDVVEREINGNRVTYPAVICKDGTALSLQQMMNISSMNGYKTEGEFINQTIDNPEGVKVTAKVADDFDFSEATQPATRNFLEYFDMAVTTKYFEGKTITYLGQVVRPSVAVKDAPESIKGNKQLAWKKGMKRAQAVKLWNIA